VLLSCYKNNRFDSNYLFTENYSAKCMHFHLLRPRKFVTFHQVPEILPNKLCKQLLCLKANQNSSLSNEFNTFG